MLTILIADDEEMVRQALADFFSSDPRFRVLPTATDAVMAETLAREHLPDIALLDVRMPGGGGPAAARAIKACSPATSIVALSAHDDRETVLEMLENGATGYVVKGGDPNLIMDAALRAAAGLATLSPEIAVGVIEAAAGQLTLSRDAQVLQKAKRAGADELRHALAEAEFRLVYQPKVSLATDRTIGVEALLRWHHPERGVVPPLDFIPLAEESGLIVPIGAWVLEQACRQADSWSNALPGGRPITVAVNVSPRQFESGLVETFGEIILKSGIDPATICLEVTEGTVMQDAQSAIETLRQLKALGTRISIDDFGTGFSSLAYLKKFPLDELKVDKSFVDGLGVDPEDTAIVAAVMGMAHALGLRVVAEGVENADQAARLRHLGCDQAQGYYFGRPGSAGEVDELLHAESAARARQPDGPAGARADNTFAERILVVDDAHDVRQLARASLTAAGFEVWEAVSGEEALSIAREVLPDCVILDVNLPGISGLEVCRILRQDTEAQQPTIVMLTADAGAAEKVQAFALKADDYMVKPFSPRDLVSRVTAAMRRSGVLAGVAE